MNYDHKGEIKNKKSGKVRTYILKDGKIDIWGTDIFRQDFAKLQAKAKWEILS